MMGRYALIVATYEYRDTGLKRLVAPRHDAESLAAVLADREIAGFDVTTLVNEPHHVVGEVIGDFFSARRRDDLSLLYFSGHGLKDDEGRLFFAMSNTRRDGLLFTAVPAQSVNDAMTGCLSREKILILDCCYSGAFPGGWTTKGDSAVNTLERFGGGRGKVVLTASDATQYSFEGNELRGSGSESIFTRHLVEGMRSGAADQDEDGDIALDELYAYVYERVIAEMPQQRPKKKDDVEGRIVIARNVRWDIPGYVRSALASPIPGDRMQAITNLARLHANGNPAVRARVTARLTELLDDDSKQVSQAAAELLRWGTPTAGENDTDRRQAEEQTRRAEEQRREAEEARERQAAKQAREAEQQRRQAAESATATEEPVAEEPVAEEPVAEEPVAEEPVAEEAEERRRQTAARDSEVTDRSARPAPSGGSERWVASLILLAGAVGGFAAEFLIWDVSLVEGDFYKEDYHYEDWFPWPYDDRLPTTSLAWESWLGIVAAGVYASRRYGPYALGYLLGSVVLACPALIIYAWLPSKIDSDAIFILGLGFWVALGGTALLAVGIPMGCRTEHIGWSLAIRRGDPRAFIGAVLAVAGALALYLRDHNPAAWLAEHAILCVLFVAVALLDLNDPQRRMALTTVVTIAAVTGVAAVRVGPGDTRSVYVVAVAVVVSALGCVIAQARPSTPR
jgi:hypothetical protein